MGWTLQENIGTGKIPPVGEGEKVPLAWEKELVWRGENTRDTLTGVEINKSPPHHLTNKNKLFNN